MSACEISRTNGAARFSFGSEHSSTSELTEDRHVKNHDKKWEKEYSSLRNIIIVAFMITSLSLGLSSYVIYEITSKDLQCQCTEIQSEHRSTSTDSIDYEQVQQIINDQIETLQKMISENKTVSPFIKECGTKSLVECETDLITDIEEKATKLEKELQQLVNDQKKKMQPEFDEVQTELTKLQNWFFHIAPSRSFRCEQKILHDRGNSSVIKATVPSKTENLITVAVACLSSENVTVSKMISVDSENNPTYSCVCQKNTSTTIINCIVHYWQCNIKLVSM